MNEQTTNTNTAANDEPLVVLSAVDDTAVDREVVYEKLADAATPGYQAEFDPNEADYAGAFEEDALSEQDAAESSDDLVEPEEKPAFLDDEGPMEPAFNHHRTASISDMFDWKPGETLDEAIARKKAQEG
ncbi:MAG: conjugal transfer protein TraD [Zoogloeaceae bacterium]|jgi:hypothetical protein|nr:conjugal transfer protein TraD [Zoogloeaceae bacterium]